MYLEVVEVQDLLVAISGGDQSFDSCSINSCVLLPLGTHVLLGGS
jgi:hypothetical protein